MSQIETGNKCLKTLLNTSSPPDLMPKLVNVSVTWCDFCHNRDSFFARSELNKGPSRGVIQTVNELKDLDSPELKKLFRKHLIRGFIFLAILILLIFVLGLSFKPQIESMANWISSKFGFLGMGITVFMADLIISPIPPDFALYVIGQSPMHNEWLLWVPLLGIVSTVAGLCGWFIGRRLMKLRVFRKVILTFSREHRGSIKKYGFWMVVIGALTPLPFSLTCWLAGIFKLPLETFAVAALFRVPRFVLYYWAIKYSGDVAGLLRGLIEATTL